jgi:uncharacterized repeat protein (TIGR03847 family)
MPPIVHDFSWPDRVIVGTVGQPGSRTFYLQVRTGRERVSVALEKQQAALLAEKIDEILDQLTANEGNQWSIPAETPLELVDNEPLEQPVDEDFRAGAMSLGWDPSTAQVVIEAYPIVDVDDEALPDSEDFDSALDAALAEVLNVPIEEVTDGRRNGEFEDEFSDAMGEPDEILVVRMPVGTARAFASRTREVVGAGRPICPFCARPIDPEGHTCVLPDGLGM